VVAVSIHVAFRTSIAFRTIYIDDASKFVLPGKQRDKRYTRGEVDSRVSTSGLHKYVSLIKHEPIALYHIGVPVPNGRRMHATLASKCSVRCSTKVRSRNGG
jgi:hypothetical protein